MDQKLLIVCGPTSTGKTALGIKLAHTLNGEIVSADSRQVYVGKNLVYGKDLPKNATPVISSLLWQDRKLKYYEVDGIRTWLYDVVDQGADFNLAFWRECALIVIQDIYNRGKLPIIVGGTGLFIKSLLTPMELIDVPFDTELRSLLQNMDAQQLFDYLNNLDSTKASLLNDSDKKNPRRLIRAIEIAKNKNSIVPHAELPTFDVVQIGLTSTLENLLAKVDAKIEMRIEEGASLEDPELVANKELWLHQEHQIVRHQLTWFKKQPNITWFDVSSSTWQAEAEELVQKWYNESHA